MGQLADAVKAAASVIWGTGPVSIGDSAGPVAGGDVFTGFDAGVARSIVDSMAAGDLYTTQPHLRTVVSFVARNGAQLGRHVYSDGEDGRVRVKDSIAASVLTHPNDYMSGYDLFNMLFSELALYDMAIWVPVYRDSRWQIDPIPGEWVTGIRKASAFQTDGYQVKYPTKNTVEFLPAKDVIVFRGYSPGGFQRGSSAVTSLRGTLGEQVAAMDFRSQMWKRGGRVGMFMTRPADAPTWSPEAKAKFIQNWRNNWSGGGSSAGSTPLLEDGMKLERIGFNAKEEQWLEAATLSLSTVAGAYHVPPAMVGVSGYNSFASVKEFRKMLYTETLGPSIAQVEDTINNFLFPFIGESSAHYFELNIGEKLQGDFDEQASVLQAAVGGPYMTVNEARAKNNLPKVDGGDDLLAPLNMGAAGNNGPLADEPIDTTETPDTEAPAPVTDASGMTTDDIVARVNAAAVLIRSGFDPEAALAAVNLSPITHLGLLPVTVQKPLNPDGDVDEELVADVATTPPKSAHQAHTDGELAIKAKRRPAAPSASSLNALAKDMAQLMKRQQADIADKIKPGQKADPSWWNQKKWNRELSGILQPHMANISAGVARTTAGAKGLDPKDYSVGRTTNFLKAVADSRADLINTTTREALVKAAADSDAESLPDAINHVFTVATESRTKDAAHTMGTMLAAWAVTEVARQLVPDKEPTKTWVSSGLPDSRHGDMDGETVGLDEKFSNGADWPGDPVLGAEGVSNCGCGVDINYDK